MPPRAPPGPPRGGTTFSPSTRAAPEQLYDGLYLDEADALNNWDGSVGGCADRTTGATFKDGVLHRINYFRAMAGVADVALSPVYDAQAQGAALLMAANQDLDHTPPPD